MRLPRRLRPGSPAVIVTIDTSSPALHTVLRSLTSSPVTIRHRHYRGVARLLSISATGVTVEPLDDVTPEPVATFLSYQGLRSLTGHGPER